MDEATDIPSMEEIMAQAESMPTRVKRPHAALGNDAVEVTAAVGGVKFVVSGIQVLKRVEVDPALFERGERAAVNQGMADTRQLAVEQLGTPAGILGSKEEDG